MFASFLKRFLSWQLLVKLSTTSRCWRSHTSNILKVFLLRFSRKISFSSYNRNGCGSELYMTA
jgi:hypothetical protein